jgi:DhnA family fructose-bisphosphate aldolase class Ia
MIMARKPRTETVHVDCVWDEEACVWIATSADIKGLVLEDGSLDRLMYRVTEAVPELIKLNNQSSYHPTVMLRAKKRQAALA